jgi:hypothetical protein
VNALAALGLAVATGTLAIAAVAVDLAYSLEARLEASDGGGWSTVSSQDDSPKPFPGGCPGPHLRLTVHNGRFVDAEVHVQVTYYDYRSNGNGVEVLDETWRVESGSTRSHEFTIPASAFADLPNGGQGSVSVNAQVDGLYLGTCVQEVAE